MEDHHDAAGYGEQKEHGCAEECETAY